MTLVEDCSEIDEQHSCLVLLYVQNDFGLSKLSWSGTNCFGQTQFVVVVASSEIVLPQCICTVLPHIVSAAKNHFII